MPRVCVWKRLVCYYGYIGIAHNIGEEGNLNVAIQRDDQQIHGRDLSCLFVSQTPTNCDVRMESVKVHVIRLELSGGCRCPIHIDVL